MRTVTGHDLFECLSPCENQVHHIRHSSTRFPPKGTFYGTDDFLLLTKKIQKSCRPEGSRFADKRELIEKAYPNICSYFSDSVNKAENENVWNVENDKMEDFIKLMRKYAEDNISKLKIFITTPHVTEIVRDERMSLTTLISNIGGILGLCIGFSAISVAEIFWYILRIDVVGH